MMQVYHTKLTQATIDHGASQYDLLIFLRDFKLSETLRRILISLPSLPCLLELLLYWNGFLLCSRLPGLRLFRLTGLAISRLFEQMYGCDPFLGRRASTFLPRRITIQDILHLPITHQDFQDRHNPQLNFFSDLQDPYYLNGSNISGPLVICQ